jgi:hypothetical protein
MSIIESLILGTMGNFSHSSGLKVGRGVELGMDMEGMGTTGRVFVAIIAILVSAAILGLALVELGVLVNESVGWSGVDKSRFGWVAPIVGIGETLA